MEEEQTKLVEEKLKTENRLKSGAGWFFAIAGLSVINSIIMFTGGDWGFIVGLGITRLADAVGVGLAEQIGDAAKIIAFVFALIIAGVFVLFGVYARKRQAWAFVTGMVLYALDGLIFLIVQDWLSMGFHAFALFGIYGGYKAGKKLQQITSSQAACAESTTTYPTSPG